LGTHSGYIFLPPVTLITCPVTYENSGLATANTTFAASVAVPGLPSGISGNPPSALFSPCFAGIPNATFVPSGSVTLAPFSFASVNRV